MALLAEQLVDEWLNREGYFTIRGLKEGVHEIDLLAIKPHSSGIEARHIEVQVSFRPVSYISKLNSDLQKQTLAKSANSAKMRSPDILAIGVTEWIDKKFRAPVKCRMRDNVFKGASWKFEFVHGVVKDSRELELIQNHGVLLTPFKEILSSLCSKKNWVGGAGTDIAEMIAYHAQ
jgi:hypothetical protein